MKRGAPILIEQFRDLGSLTSVQKALSRLAQEGVVERVYRGIYARPAFVAGMSSIKVAASAQQIAKKWAQRYGYTIVSQGAESAYRLGFQTQAPMKIVLWSDGADKTFAVGNQVVEVRNVAESQLRWKSRPAGKFYRAISVTPANSVKLNALKDALLSRLNLDETQSLDVIRKLKSVPLPEGWHAKLERLESDLRRAV
ncbi:hypothetical protein GCM10022278_38270 [Allohahella marinimesophila]|uniref:Transcriptional regulator, AbiEi antitoxin, Type IV TA system n=2 Tax=Allohahella marinimesophila TaxID=1054972 RepID=A0ABP7Q8D9_9GAMM